MPPSVVLGAPWYKYTVVKMVARVGAAALAAVVTVAAAAAGLSCPSEAPFLTARELASPPPVRLDAPCPRQLRFNPRNPAIFEPSAPADCARLEVWLASAGGTGSNLIWNWLRTDGRLLVGVEDGLWGSRSWVVCESGARGRGVMSLGQQVVCESGVRGRGGS
jgi:hypothetical protein